MADKRNFAALDWIIDEVSQTLNDARQALEGYVDDPRDSTKMRFCLTHIHQVHGSLQIVEFFGASLLAEEMEQLAQAIINQEVSSDSEAQEVLMRALLQLPNYLEHVKQLRRDHPGVVLPLLNDLRAVRKQSYLSETNLFSPDLSSIEEVSGDRHAILADNAKIKQVLNKLREMYQFAAASVLKNIKVDENLAFIDKVVIRMEALSRGTRVHPIWEASSALVEGLKVDDIHLSVAVRGLMRYLARELRILAEHGVKAFDAPPRTSLLKNLLYYIGMAEVEAKTPRIAKIRQRFALAEAMAEIDSTAGNQSSAAGGLTKSQDVDAIRSVIVALTEELTMVQNKLDATFGSDPSPGDIRDLVPVLRRIGDTLAVLGIGDLRKTVVQQAEALEKISTQSSTDSNDVYQVAAKVVEIEQRLNAIYKVAGTGRDLDQIDEAAVQFDDAKQQVITQCQAGLESIKECIVEYISTQWDKSHLEEAKELMQKVRGGLNMLPLERASNVIAGCIRYASYLIESDERPKHGDMETLADAISGVETYFELLPYNDQAQLDDNIEISEAAVDALEAKFTGAPQDTAEEESPNYLEEDAAAAVPEATFSETTELDAESDKQVEVQAESHDLRDANDEAREDPVADNEEQSAPAEPVSLQAPTSTGGKRYTENIDAPLDAIDIDEEIVEIFIEEAGEVMETLHEEYPRWKEDPTNDDSRSTVRRSFHTLKGSGRMVEAFTVGETAWAIENMLNRVIDGTIALSAAHFNLIEMTLDHLALEIKAFEDKKQDPQPAKTALLRELGDALSKGEEIPDLLNAPFDAEAFINERLGTETESVKDKANSDSSVESDSGPADKAYEGAQSDERAIDADDVPLPVVDLDDAETTHFENEASSEDTTLATPIVHFDEDDNKDDDTDYVLHDIFVSEAKTHLVTMRAFSNELQEAAPIYPPPSDDLQRALHTLKGSARMASIEPIGAIAEPLEHLAKEMVAYQVPMDDNSAQLLADGIEKVEQGLACIEAHKTIQIDDLDAFIKRIHATHAETIGSLQNRSDDESGDSHKQVADPRLLNEFISTDMDVLLDFEEHLPAWRDGKVGQSGLAASMQNELAQLDKAASLAKLEPLQRISQGLKVIYDHVLRSDQNPLPRYFDQIFSGHEALLGMIDLVAAGQIVRAPDESVFEGIEKAIDGLVDDQDRDASKDQESDSSLSIDIPTPGLEEEPIAAVGLAGVPLMDGPDIETETIPGEVLGEGDIASTVSWEDETIEASLDSLHADDTDKVEAETESEDLSANNDIKEPSASSTVTTDEDLKEPSAFSALQADENSEEPSASSSVTTGEDLEEPSASSSVSTDEDLEVPSNSSSASIEANDSVTKQAAQADAGSTNPDLLDIIDTSSEDFDEDILDVFLEEANEIIEELDESVHQWESDWSNTEAVEDIKRSLHTLKGGARLAGMMNLGELTHDYETFLITTDLGDVDKDFFKKVHGYQDRVLRAVRAVSAFMAGDTAGSATDIPSPETSSPTPAPQTSTSEATTTGDVSEVTQATPITPTQANVVPFKPRPQTADNDGAAGAFSMPTAEQLRAQQDVSTKTRQSGPQEVIKVNAELLEELVNLAGETSISRGRVEQHINDFNAGLGEVEGTIRRLEEQLRRLDTETQAQIMFRQEQMAESDRDFDPLEMDRYSALQQLSRSLIESASDLVDLKETLSGKVRDTETLLIQQSRINSTLQEGLMRSRMVPFSRMVPRLRRIVRQVATELGKQVSFELDNVEGELDRSVLERMVAPLEHMLRNAVDHGIEMPEQRAEAGKPEQGRIILSLGREGGDVILRLIDDGRGVNIDRVREKAMERGLMEQNAELTDHDVMQFILQAGFSTAESVSQISGRGVGMDVVASEIKALGGSVQINSRWGEGTEFFIRLPFTVSVNRALMVQLKNDFYAVPLNTIEGIVRVSPFELEHYYSNPDARFEYAGENYHVRYLGSMLAEDRQPNLEGQALPLPVLLVRSAEHTMALQVDTLHGSSEIVVKNLGSQFASVQGLSGATLMGDGSVVVILDPHALMRQELAHGQRMTYQPNLIGQEPANKVRTVMVVDDSVTVRKVTTRFLEREGFEVITAKDGVDALKTLQETIPDIMLLDIEMPRMDGFEVARNIRGTQRWKHLPIIMITSRTGDKHREHAMSIGVNQYLGKPYQEDVLMENINKLLDEAKASKSQAE